MKVKVGDKVRAITNDYDVTSIENQWEGIVTYVRDDGTFDAVTTKHIDSSEIGEECHNLNPEYFELITPETIIVITNDGKTIRAQLKQDKKIVKTTLANCSPKGKFDLKTDAKLVLDKLFEEFVPHLEYFGENWGTIGTPTKMKDALGRPLFIGDVVTIRPLSLSPSIICEDGNEQFVMGIANVCKRDGRITDGWRVYKSKDHAELTHGETYRDIRVVIKNNTAINPLSECECGVQDHEEEELVYKVGDRVRIVKKKIGENWNPEGAMDKWLGQTMTIKSVRESGMRFYKMKEDDELWCWYPWMIEGLAKPLVIKREGKECGIVGTPTGLQDIHGKDLFVGDIVKLRTPLRVFNVYMVKGLSNCFQPSGCGYFWKKDGTDVNGWKVEKLVDWIECKSGDKLGNCLIEEK